MTFRQDWEPRILNSNKKKLVKKPLQQKKETVKKEEKEEDKINYISFQDAKKITELRCQKGMTQKELAVKLDVKVDQIRAMESGLSINNPRLQARIFQILA
jgi:ribosome-binding protein aMBF1 (putative translation factor)